MTRSRKRKLARNRARNCATWYRMPLASALIVGGGMAHAADATDTAADTTTLEEVVVTAQKRTEDLQKVPISLQVLTTQQLEQHQVTSFDDFAKLLPSLSFQSLGPGQSQIYFRGISSGGGAPIHAGALPATGTYLDEIPVTTIGNTLDVHIYDIARVEALAGPQGTLYGASSLSGTLRIITNKPDPSAFSASYDLKADKYGRGNPGEQFEGYVNIPLSDHIAVRLVGFYDHQGGYINNLDTTNVYQRGIPAAGIPDAPIAVSNFGNPPGAVEPNVAGRRFNPVTTYGGRGALKIDLNDNWTLLPQVLVQDQRADGNFTYDPDKGFLNVGDYGNEINEDKWWQSALTVEGKVSNFDILYSGGYFERNVHNVVDYSEYTVAYDAYSQYAGATSSSTRFVDCKSGTPANNCNGGPSTLADPTQFVNNHDRYTKLSQELRVTTPVDYRLRGTAGLFYQRQSDDIRAAFSLHDLPSYYSIDGSPNILYLSAQTRVDRDYAVFGDATFDLTDKLKISAGIRQFWVNNTLYGFFGFQSYCDRYGFGSYPVVPNYRPCVDTNKKVVEDGETHKVTLTYQVDPDRLVYATYSTGFRPGGNNRLPFVAAYAADTLTNYEVGWKTAWLDHRLRVNGAVFYEQWNNLQYAVTGVSGITSIVNAANAHTKGIEGDIDYRVVANLTLSASGTYVDARTTQNLCELNIEEQVVHSCPSDQLVAPSGTQLPVTPKLKANASARYTFNLADYQNFAQATVFHQGSSTTELQQNLNAYQGDVAKFTTVDFSVGTGTHNWHVKAFIENAFDEQGQLGRQSQCSFTYCYVHSRVYPIKPQFFGVEFGQKF